MKKAEFVPDDTQREVIEATGGDHLVLASPGCGKTQILSERIRRAHHQGVPFDQMLCLTFTNRAARGMFERIHDTVDDHQVDDVFVGNVHRFCSWFLFTNELVPGDSSIIDDEESVSIIARFMQEDEDRVNHDFHRKRYYSQVMQLSHLIHQVVNGHSRDVRMHAEVLEKDDIRSLRIICQAQGMQFSALALDDIYRHTDFYQGLLDGEAYRDADGRQLRLTLRKLQLAYQYEKYKTDHHLLDFEDLLILTFDILNNDELHQYPRYGWIQVDEVQDLNPLQMRIIDLLTDQDATVVYLGDDQQAIFSFMGAKMENIELLKDRCQGHIHHLGINHRSPYYLLRVFNDYAQKVLDISPELLPAPADLNAGQGNELKISHSKNLEQEFADVAQMVAGCLRYTDKESMAVIVNSNSDAQMVSETLLRQGIPHFKISGDDLFSTIEMKCLIAHFDLLSNSLNFHGVDTRAARTAHIGVVGLVQGFRPTVQAALHDAQRRAALQRQHLCRAVRRSLRQQRHRSV